MSNRTRMAFVFGVLGITLTYLLVETRYITHFPLGADEFLDMYVLQMFRGGLPYRDFTPPKTVLAFYLDLPVFAAVGDPWRAMLAVKLEHAILAAATMFGGALVLGRRLPTAAVLGALAMLVTMSTFLERSAELHVDQIAAVFGFLSLLALIERRPMLAGLFAAGAFLSTQKGVYFVLAGQAGLLAELGRVRTARMRATWLRFTFSSAAILAAYLAFWSLFASPRTVIRDVFLDRSIVQIASTVIYTIRSHYWLQTFVQNPLFYGIAAAGAVVLLGRWPRAAEDDRFAILAPYILALSLLAAWHKQPWPYFIALVVPPLFIVNAVFLAELRHRPRAAFVLAIIAAAIPLARFDVTMRRDNTFQRATFTTALSLLAPNETYIDGASMIYTQEQAASEFVWLDWVRMKALRDASPAQLMPLIHRIDTARPKLMLLNYRTAALPPTLQLYARSQFAPLWGNILYYAPVIAPPVFELHFDGTYLADRPARIDDIDIAAGARLPLHRGWHTMRASHPIRLRLLAPPGTPFDPRFAAGGELLRNGFD